MRFIEGKRDTSGQGKTQYYGNTVYGVARIQNHKVSAYTINYL